MVVAGVAGVGKTTVGRALAGHLGWAFEDADDHHPPQNRAKMAAGVPLDEEDRGPWLDALRRLVEASLATERSLVLACSALRTSHRQHLAGGDPRVRFAVLTAVPEFLQPRLEGREGHFMPASLLPSQLQTQEWSSEAVPFDAAEPVEELVQRIAWWSAKDRADHLEQGPAGPLRLRDAGPDDADDVAALHLRAWRHAYPGLAPRAAYQRLDLAAREDLWRRLLSTEAGEGTERFTLMAEVGETLVGFCHAGSADDGGGGGDPIFGHGGRLKYLYLDPRYARRGIGRLLLVAAAKRLREGGHRSLVLGVVAANGPAIAFYRRMGAAQAGTFIDPGPIWRSHCLLYLWEDIDVLADRFDQELGAAGGVLSARWRG